MDSQAEHPKSDVEVMENTYTSIESYAAAKQLSFSEAALVLIFNELRCMHWHYDYILAREEEHEHRSTN